MSRILALLLLVSCTAYAQVYSSGVVRGGTFWGGLTTRVVEGLGEELVSITNNMIACWPLDEAVATREDDWASFDLTDNNTVTGTMGPTGLGNASSFAGASLEYLSHADDASLRMGDYSTTWVIWVNVTLSGFPAIISKENGADRQFLVYHDGPANKFHWVVFDAIGNGDVTSTGTFAEGSGWHMIVCGYDKPNNRIFMSIDNGAMDTDTMLAAPIGGTAALTFGEPNSGFDYLTGALAGAALWNRLLTAIEREALYASGNGSRACEEQGN